MRPVHWRGGYRLMEGSLGSGREVARDRWLTRHRASGAQRRGRGGAPSSLCFRLRGIGADRGRGSEIEEWKRGNVGGGRDLFLQPSNVLLAVPARDECQCLRARRTCSARHRTLQHQFHHRKLLRPRSSRHRRCCNGCSTGWQTQTQGCKTITRYARTNTRPSPPKPPLTCCDRCRPCPKRVWTQPAPASTRVGRRPSPV